MAALDLTAFWGSCARAAAPRAQPEQSECVTHLPKFRVVSFWAVDLGQVEHKLNRVSETIAKCQGGISLHRVIQKRTHMAEPHVWSMAVMPIRAPRCFADALPTEATVSHFRLA